MEIIPCPLCKKAGTFWGTIARSIYYRCLHCGVVFLNPLPGEDSLARYYGERYSRIFSMKKRSEKAILLDLGLLPGSALLDIGSSSGDFMAEAAAAGLIAEGIEVRRESVDSAAARNLRVFHGSIETYEPPHLFSCVTLFHTLEHLPDPVSVLQKIRDMLEPEGIVVITVPNFGSLSARILGRYWEWFQPPAHIFQFSPLSVERALKEAGLKVKKMTTRKSFAPSFFVNVTFYLPIVILKASGIYYGVRDTSKDDSLRLPLRLLHLYLEVARIITFPITLLFSPLQALLDKKLLGDELVVFAVKAHPPSGSTLF